MELNLYLRGKIDVTRNSMPTPEQLVFEKPLLVAGGGGRRIWGGGGLVDESRKVGSGVQSFE